MFNRIYDLTYESILTPHNLIDNLQLDNYQSLHYSKQDGFIVCEIKCIVDSVEWCFYYLFNKDNSLQSAYYLENGERSYLFNRATELESLRNKFNKKTA